MRSQSLALIQCAVLLFIAYCRLFSAILQLRGVHNSVLTSKLLVFIAKLLGVGISVTKEYTINMLILSYCKNNISLFGNLNIVIEEAYYSHRKFVYEGYSYGA